MIKFEDGKIDVEQGQIRILRASENMCSDPGWRLVAIIPGADESYPDYVVDKNNYNGGVHVTKYRPGAPFLVMRRDPDAALEEAHEVIKDAESRLRQSSDMFYEAEQAKAKAEKERDVFRENFRVADEGRKMNAETIREMREKTSKYEKTLGTIRKLMGDKWFKDNGVDV